MPTKLKRSRSLNEKENIDQADHDLPNKVVRNKRNKIRVVQTQSDTASKSFRNSKNNGCQKTTSTTDNINADNTVTSELSRCDSVRNATTDESPGHSNETCVFCAEACVDSNSISCEGCDHWYHLECCGVKGEDAFLVKTLMNVLGWTCRACRKDSFNIIKKLQTEVELLRSAQLLLKAVDTDVVVKDTY